MKGLVLFFLLVCGIVADKERLDDLYSDVLSDKLLQKLEKRLMEWEQEYDKDTSSDGGDHDTYAEGVTCHFKQQEDTIIRTTDSMNAGATYVNSPNVTSRELCRQECCKLGTKCNLAVFKDKRGEYACYLFDCGTPNICNFSQHEGYVSMQVTGWLDDNQKPLDQHEHALAQLATDPPSTVPPKLESAAPQNLRVVAVTSSSITIRWDSQDNVFTVHYYPTDGQGAGVTRVVDSNEMVAENLRPFTKYTFYVKAYAMKGSSIPSDKVTQLTEDDVPEAAPEVTVTPAGSDLKVTWKELSPSDARGLVTEYKVIYRKHNSRSETRELVPASVNEYVIKDVDPGETYDVAVSAKTRAGYADLEDKDKGWVTVTTKPLPSQGRECSRFQVACKTGSLPCIAIYDKCDGVKHCSDGSDEEDCDSQSNNSDGGQEAQGWSPARQYERPPVSVQQEYDQTQHLHPSQAYNQAPQYIDGQQPNNQGPINSQAFDNQQLDNRQPNIRQPNNQQPNNQQPKNQQLNNQRPKYHQLNNQQPKNQQPNQQQSINRPQLNQRLNNQGPLNNQVAQLDNEEQGNIPNVPVYKQPIQVQASQISPNQNARQYPNQRQYPQYTQNLAPQPAGHQVSDQQVPPQQQPLYTNQQVASPYQTNRNQPIRQPQVPAHVQSPQRGPNNIDDQQNYMQGLAPQEVNRMPPLRNPYNDVSQVNSINIRPKQKAQMPPQPASHQQVSSQPMGRDGVPVSELHDHSQTQVHDTKQGKNRASHHRPQDEGAADADSKTLINYSDGGKIITHIKGDDSNKHPTHNTQDTKQSEDGTYNSQYNAPNQQYNSAHGHKPSRERGQTQYPSRDRSYMNSYRQNSYPYGYRGQSNTPDETYFNLPSSYIRNKGYSSYPRYDNSIYNYIIPGASNNDFDYDYNGLETGGIPEVVQRERQHNNNAWDVYDNPYYPWNGQKPGSGASNQHGPAPHPDTPDSDKTPADVRPSLTDLTDRIRPNNSRSRPRIRPETIGLRGKMKNSSRGKFKERPEASDLEGHDSEVKKEQEPEVSPEVSVVEESVGTETAAKMETQKQPEVSSNKPSGAPTEQMVPQAAKKSSVAVEKPGKLSEVNDESLEKNDEAVKNRNQNIKFNQTAIVVLALGLSFTALLLIFAGCRVRTVKRRLRKGRPLNANEADYLVNGMYL